MSENTPSQIGDYEIVRELGHGGMGKVYKVRNLLSDRIEAMKIVLPDLAGRSEFVSRFMREIKVLASLEHPNIAALRTAFTSGDQFVMVMEYVEGVTLGDRLEQGTIPTSEALNYIDQALTALSYAHGKHIIHRDIKPGNMMLTPQGVVKLMDFGLARSANEVGLTMTGSTVGSLDYLSPEQVKSQPTDERSDLYSVGVSLYQMVTHQRMFNATSSYSIMEAHVKETPRAPIELMPVLPKPVSDLIMMSVAKDPAQRFQSAEAFRAALSQVRESCGLGLSQAMAATVTVPVSQPAVTQPLTDRSPDQPAPTTPPPAMAQPAPAKSGRGVLLVVAVVILLAVLAAGWFYKSRSGNQSVASVPEKPLNNAPSPVATGPSQNSTTPPPQSPAPEAAISPPAQSPAASVKHAGRANANSAGVMTPGGSVPDQPQQPIIDQKKLLDDLEKENDQLGSRAAAVESSLDTLEQQMRQSGLGLRGDMVAARNNMRSDLQKAKQAMDSADTERARHFLDLAHRDVEKLEAFLGHR